MLKVNVVRMANAAGNYHFYHGLSIILSGPLVPDDDAGFMYIVRGRRYDSDNKDFVGAYATPEEAWKFYMDFESKCQGSCWRLDEENCCFVDADGIRFNISGSALP